MDVAIVSATDLNPKYLACAPWFIQFWLAQKSSIPGVKYVPRVIVVAESLPDVLYPFSEFCELYNSKLPGSFVAQNIRTMFAGLVREDLAITSDIDMLPLNTKIFDTAISKLNDSMQCYEPPTFTVIRDVLPAGQFAICYSVASPRAWRDVMNIDSKSDMSAVLDDLFREKVDREEFISEHGGHGWFVDQEILYGNVQKAVAAKKVVLTRMSDEETGHKRLDRIYHRGIIKWLVLPLVQRSYYTDYHVHFPVQRNRKYLGGLLRRI